MLLAANFKINFHVLHFNKKQEETEVQMKLRLDSKSK